MSNIASSNSRVLFFMGDVLFDGLFGGLFLARSSSARFGRGGSYSGGDDRRGAFDVMMSLHVMSFLAKQSVG